MVAIYTVFNTVFKEQTHVGDPAERRTNREEEIEQVNNTMPNLWQVCDVYRPQRPRELPQMGRKG